MAAPVFVDSSFWVALRARRDDRHSEAQKLMRAHDERALLTSNHVRGETWTLLRKWVSHASAVDFLDLTEQSPRLEVVDVAANLEEEALGWLRQHDERVYSFVDATSFALMRAEGISSALAFDGDFSAAGFEELRA